MSSNNEETLKKWGNVLQSNNLTQLCPILTAEENIQQTGGNNVQVPPLKENLFQLPVPWRKKDDVHPYKASVQPVAPITFTSNQNFPKPMPQSAGSNSACPCTCEYKTISNPMGQTQRSSVPAYPVGPSSSIKPSSQCLTKPMLWKEDVEEPICTCPKIPMPLIQPEPKRPFVKCECNELKRNLAPTNFKCSEPKPEAKMKPFLDKKEATKSEAPTAGPDQFSFRKPQITEEDKGQVCCCCEEGSKKGGKDKTENQESEKDKGKNSENNKKDGSGSDDKKSIKKHGKDEVDKRKKIENNGNKDKKSEKDSSKEDNKEISVEKEKMENKKNQNSSSKNSDAIKSVSSIPSSDNKTETTKSKGKNGKKLAADKKDPSYEQTSPDTSPSIDESKTIKSKDKKAKNVKKDKEKRGKESDCLKKVTEIASKLPPDFVADFAKGMYPGITVGHATCCLPSIRIPCKMGWLWNSCEGAGKVKPDLGWRPGAIRANTFSAMKAGRKLAQQNKEYEEEDIKPDEKKDGDQGGKDDSDEDEDDSDVDIDLDAEFEDELEGKGKRRRSKASVMIKEEEEKEIAKPTLHLHKTKGQYLISMYTPDEKEKEENEGRVLMTFNRKTLELGSSASSSSSGTSSTVTEDSLELDYTTPYALYKQAKRAEQCNRQTQWEHL